MFADTTGDPDPITIGQTPIDTSAEYLLEELVLTSTHAARSANALVVAHRPAIRVGRRKGVRKRAHGIMTIHGKEHGTCLESQLKIMSIITNSSVLLPSRFHITK